jgi:hypothetical protein
MEAKISNNRNVLKRVSEDSIVDLEWVVKINDTI